MVALLTMGSAILLISCKAQAPAEPVDEETVISKLLEDMTNITTDNGEKTQRFYTPLLEDYEFAKEPFSEYRKGIEVVSYDSLGLETSNIVADYALHWTKRDMWELKGNVVAQGDNGNRKLYTQQLFWDRKIKRFYSNVDSKVEEGTDVFIGEGFDADDDFKRWTFRKLKGQVSVDTEPAEPAAPEPVTDSLAVPAKDSVSVQAQNLPSKGIRQNQDRQ